IGESGRAGERTGREGGIRLGGTGRRQLVRSCPGRGRRRDGGGRIPQASRPVAEETQLSKPMEIIVAKPIPSKGVKPPAPGPEMDALLKRAAKGDESCLPQVRAMLADPEHGALTTRYCGSSAEWL